MKFPNLHITWTEGKNLSLPDLLSRSLRATTHDEHRLLRVEILTLLNFSSHITGTLNLYNVTMLYQKKILTQ